MRYESHPEIAVQDAWSTERLRKELARLRKLGLEPIPKLNFSTTHDAWLGVYSRQVSTPPYYKDCEDLIEEVIRLFDKPRLFHLGYDEETAGQQADKDYVVVRQHELWWRDFQFFVKQVERAASSRGYGPTTPGTRRRIPQADAEERDAEQLVLRGGFSGYGP